MAKRATPGAEYKAKVRAVGRVWASWYQEEDEGARKIVPIIILVRKEKGLLGHVAFEVVALSNGLSEPEKLVGII